VEKRSCTAKCLRSLLVATAINVAASVCNNSENALASGPALRTRLRVLGDLPLAVLLIPREILDLLLASIAGFKVAQGERCLKKKTGQSLSFCTGHDGTLDLHTIFRFRLVWRSA
jgi:hypothetical protein